MKILWLEDFGGNTTPSMLFSSIFRCFFGKTEEEQTRNISLNLDEEFGFDIQNQINDLTRQFCNEVRIFHSKNYGEWSRLNKEHNYDFDIILIDINLENGSNPEERPENFRNNNDFDRKSGFYIYHQFIKKGIPDSNIAFITGETNTAADFLRHCNELLLDIPANIFEKHNDKGFPSLQKWMLSKFNNPYISLLRGIKEACNYLITRLNETPDENLKEYLIFYKSCNDEFSEDIYKIRTETEDYLKKLRNFLPLLEPEYNSKMNLFSTFIKELSYPWEKSKGYIINNNFFENIQSFCQREMKFLRNWSAHNLLAKDISEKELAFYFLIAMRGIFNSENKPLPYEKHFERIFAPSIPYEKFEEILKENIQLEKRTVNKIKSQITKSYWELISKLKDLNKYERNSVLFFDLIDDFSKVSKFQKNKSEEILNIQKESKKLLYLNYWHNLYYAFTINKNYKQNDDSISYFINFNDVLNNKTDIAVDTFIYWLCWITYELSF